jgi:AcrR family transcriptional regulator
MPYRRTENVARKLAARHDAILRAAQALASEGGMAAVQIAGVADRAGIAAGTIYRYFPSKTELIAALIERLSDIEIRALQDAGDAAPGPLSALAATITTFAAHACANRRLVFALIAEPIEPTIEAARVRYRRALSLAFEQRIRTALASGHLPEQDVAITAPALVGAVIEGLIGPLVSNVTVDPLHARAEVQSLTLFTLRALGVVDARARGLVVQAAMPAVAGVA